MRFAIFHLMICNLSVTLAVNLPTECIIGYILAKKSDESSKNVKPRVAYALALPQLAVIAIDGCQSYTGVKPEGIYARAHRLHD